MKQNIIKFFLSITTLLCILLFSSCGLLDWSYKLSNGYEIWRINSNDIVLEKVSDESYEIALGRYILEFCYNESFVGLKRLSIDDDIPYASVHIDEMDQSNPDYYLVDTENDLILGPMSSDEYYIQIENSGIDNMSDWIKTYPAPKGAEFFCIRSKKLFNVLIGMAFAVGSFILCDVFSLIAAYVQLDNQFPLENLLLFLSVDYGVISVCLFKSTYPERLIRVAVKPVAFFITFLLFYRVKSHIIDLLGLVPDTGPGGAMFDIFVAVCIIFGTAVGLMIMGIITAVKNSARQQ